jgi:nucleoside-diphosphate-sugar epimerase
MKSALVIGANSMLGAQLVKALSTKGIDVLTAGRSPAADIYFDLRDGFLGGLPENIYANVVFHCAASFEGDSWEDIRDNYQVNAAGCSWVLELAKHLHTEVIIYAGSVSSAEESDPANISSYGFSKRQGEDFLEWGMRRLDGRFCSLRFSQIYDTEGISIRHQPWFGRIIAYAARGLDINMPRSDGVRNLLHVEDAANMMFAAGLSSESGILNATHPESFTYQQIANMAYKIFDAGGRVIDSENKAPFRPINFPDSAHTFHLLDQSPKISIWDGILSIHDQQTWPAFGSLDVA